MRTLTIMILIAMALGIASASARVCQTECYPRNDGSGGQRCYTHCW